MSSVYSTEPAPSGKVVVKTTLGDIEVELWAKETPKACRNFIQLALEGYYDGCLVNRLVPGFIVQTGDPTNTGEGGESIYGAPFADELHSRLRFNRRGLVGMASTQPNDNRSQFFFTLDKADELNRKHTLFGRVAGDTLFNLLRIGEVEVDKDERPLHPIKIISIEVLNNPFDDIVPRTTALERRAEEEERLQEERRRKEAEERKKFASISKKNKNLLSFEEEEEPQLVAKVKSAHDIDDGTLSRQTAAEPSRTSSKKKPVGASDKDSDEDSDDDDDDDDEESESEVRKTAEREAKERVNASKAKGNEKGKDSTTAATTLQDMKDERLRTLEAEIANVSSSLKSKPGKSTDSGASKEKKPLSYVEQQRQLYLSSSVKHAMPGKKEKRKIDESDILAQLAGFTKKIRSAPPDTSAPAKESGSSKKGGHGEEKEEDEEERCALHNRANCASCKREEAVPIGHRVGSDDEELGDDDGGAWLGHALVFAKETGVRDIFKPEDYEVLDPRADRGMAGERQHISGHRDKDRARERNGDRDRGQRRDKSRDRGGAGGRDRGYDRRDEARRGGGDRDRR